MGVGQFGAGLVLGAAAVGPVVVGARAARHWLLPEWAGPPAWLCDAVITLTVVVLVSEVMGTIGLFSRFPIVIAFALVGLAMARNYRGARDAPVANQAVAAIGPRWLRGGLVVVALAVLAGSWGSVLAGVMHYGMNQTDTIWYHMPISARFVQSASTWHVHFIDYADAASWVPATSELFHALFMMFFGSDGLSPLLNIGFLVLALLAAWCIGRPFGVAAQALVGASVVFSTPMIVAVSAGDARNDIVAIAFILCAVALLVQPRSGDSVEIRSWIARVTVAGAAAGLAVSTKLTSVLPALVIVVIVMVSATRRARLRSAATFSAAMAVAGSYWYVRNLFATGNPMPTSSVGVGPLRFPVPAARPGFFIPALRLGNSHFRNAYFFPAFRNAFGSAWPLMTLVPILGCVLAALVGTNRVIRALGLLGLACIAGFLFSPGGIFESEFLTNTRYGAAGFVLGFIALVVFASGRGPVVVGVVTAALVALAVASLLVILGRRTTGDARVGWTAVIVVVVLGALVVLVGERGPQTLHSAYRLLGVAGVVVACVAAFAFQRTYFDNTWSKQPVHDARIALADIASQYPLYGGDHSNYVQVLGRRGPHGEWRWPAPDCPTWRRLLRDGRYTYVATMKPDAQFVKWTPREPATQVMVGGSPAWLYKIRQPLDITCRDQATPVTLGVVASPN